MSGGVDSSVAALLLKQEGHDVEGLFMKNWDEKLEGGACIWEADVEDAMRVCDKLGIHLNTVDLSLAYWEKVFAGFLGEYAAGRTPNPDILCNQEVKFRAFLDHARQLGADRIATGHYAGIQESDSVRLLRKGRDQNKDQSYFLCRLNQQQLAGACFPLGEFEKNDVRSLAAGARLVTHDKKDSTGICFVGERPFREFLSRYLPLSPGEIRTEDGELVGEHCGIQFYTLGQRQGLGIGGVRGALEEPWYVIAKEVDTNTLIVAQGHDHPALFCNRLTADNLHWIAGTPPAAPLRCHAKTRYRQADQACEIAQTRGNEIEVEFEQPQRAVTPGQYVVFYDGDICLGGAVIKHSFQ